METDTTLVGADGAVELNTVAKVGLDLALVVNPRYTEGDDAVGLNHTLNDFSLLELGVIVIYLLD